MTLRIIFSTFRQFSRQLSCSPPWAEDNSNICTSENVAKHVNDVMDKEADKNRCPDPCNFLNIHIGGKNVKKLEDVKLGQMYYYFAPRIMMRFQIKMLYFVQIHMKTFGNNSISISAKKNISTLS